MVHGPYGMDNHSAPCMVCVGDGLRKVDSKGFLKAFSRETVAKEDGYPLYCRRDNGLTFTTQVRGLE